MKKFIIHLLFGVSLFNLSCEKEHFVLIDEILLLGRWEPISKFFYDKNGEEFSTSEDNCEWADTYTFLENGKLIYKDSVREGVDNCGDNPNLKMEGEWSQDPRGKFTFRIRRTLDNSILTIVPRDVYITDKGFLVIALNENVQESGFSYSRIILNKI